MFEMINIYDVYDDYDRKRKCYSKNKHVLPEL